MIDNRLSQLLGFDAHGTFVKEISTSFFGKQVILDCIFNPEGEQVRFQIILEGCRHINIEVFTESFDPPEAEYRFGADLIGLNIGAAQYSREFIAHTDTFEISALYGNIKVERG